MRFQAFLTAAVLAAIPAAAGADGPPVRFVDEPVPHVDSIDVQVWIAHGYGKQLLIDHDWDDDFGINDANAAKKDGDVVVRFDLGNCADVEASLVGQLGAWFALHPTDLPPFFTKLAGDEAGWLWDFGQSLAGCACAPSTVVTYHCANGAIHSTCEAEDACGPAGTLTVQAYNRPANEKCETDLTGDGLAECDAAALGNGAGDGGGPAIVYTAPVGMWSFTPTSGCTDAEYAAGTCVATCHARNSNGTSTTITLGYTGVSDVSPGSCVNTCEALEDTTMCERPGNGGGNPHDPRLRKASPVDVWAPTLQRLQRQPARFDVHRRPRFPVQ